MKENQRIALWGGGILLVAVTALYFILRPAAEPADYAAAATEALPAVPPAAGSAAPAAEPAPEQHPMPEVATAAPLPALAESDAPFWAALGAQIDAAQLALLLVDEQLIRRLVVTVDNLPRERLAVNDRAFRRVPGQFMVKSRDGSYGLNPGNEARYQPLVTLANTVGAESVARLYLAFYPLFDQAYRELGLPDRRFNDRLVQVIDHLLATPEVANPIELVQPKVFYQFADPALEARSAGQKMLIRMGSVNAAQVKAWLTKFRARIIAGD